MITGQHRTERRPTAASVLLAATLLVAAQASGQTPRNAGQADTAEGARPNILLIVADDMGYSDLGVFGSEIPTPNIDALAQSGMLLTDFFANMACSPTRAMLMSGMDSHLAGLGVMGRALNPAQRDQPGYEGHLNFRVASLAALLRDAGYHTYMTGKWHLGEAVETGPAARGFEHAFASIDGAAHLGGLSWNGPGLAPYRDDQALVTVSDDFYSTRVYTERMIDYIDADRADGAPFFAYLAYTAPHWPLQAPAASVEKFRGWYDEGYEALYRSRLARAKTLGLVASDFEGIPPVPGQPAWDELSDEEQRVESRKMEIYAAMISDLDRYVGELMAYLETIGARDDTFILFFSDNGPEATRRDLAPGLREWVASCCDNSYENLGRGDSYVMYGPNWARASSVPFRRAKSTAFEGGTHVPAFATYPGVIPAGTRSDAFATVMDVLPTLLALAGTHHPGHRYKGRDVLPPQGRSLLPVLTGRRNTARRDDDVIGWELYGHRAVRRGNWKIVWDPTRGDAARWELFNLAEDRGEQMDLSTTMPARLDELQNLWDEYARRNGVILAR